MEEKDTLFEEALRSAIENLLTLEPGSEEYKRQAEAIHSLMSSKTESKAQEMSSKTELKVQDARNKATLIQTLVYAGVGLGQLLLVIGFEKADVFKLKEAMKCIFRPRI